MKPWSLVALAVVSIFVYAHAIRAFFSRAAGVDARMRVLQWSGTVAAALHVWALWQSDGVPVARWLTSALLYGLGLVVFLAARAASRNHRLTLAFSRDAPWELLRSGIYEIRVALERRVFVVVYPQDGTGRRAIRYDDDVEVAGHRHLGHRDISPLGRRALREELVVPV